MSSLAIGGNHLIRPIGFAESQQPAQATFVDNKWLHMFVNKKTVIAIAIVSALVVTASYFCSFAFTPIVMTASFINLASLSSFVLLKIFERKKICQSAGMVDSSQVIIDYSHEVDVLPTRHCANTDVWRKRLIKTAKENIVLSGNFAGGVVFDEYLDLIRRQLTKKPNLKVVILAYPGCIADERSCKNITKINEMLSSFPNRFSIVDCPTFFHLSTNVKFSMNHTKCLVIDYGKYFVLGGSGVKDNFADTGIHGRYRRLDIQALRDTAEGSFFGHNFRDQDFVFRSSQSHLNGHRYSLGNRVYQQMLLLSHRWEQICRQAKIGNRNIIRPDPTYSVTQALLSGHQKKETHTEVRMFLVHNRKVDCVHTDVLSQGPEENTSSEFFRQMIAFVQRAQRRIVIDHSYFHPSDELMQALIDAAKRGVKVQLITNNVHENSPSSHRIFGPRNQYNYWYFYSSLPEEARQNFEVYEYNQNRTGNHKKVVVIDDRVLAGSSNMGYKSQITTSDHEINFIAKSVRLASKVLKIVKQDIRHSRRIYQPSVNLLVRGSAIQHRLLSSIIG